MTAAETRTNDYVDVDPQQLATLGEDLRIVDVRERDEYEGQLGHLPGAQLVPLRTLDEAAATWDRNQVVLLVCRSGRRSAEAALRLAAAGFARVFNLRGGTQAYLAAGLCTEHGSCPH